MSCGFCASKTFGPDHSSSDHRCGRCGQTGHPGYAKHCEKCLSLDHDEKAHTCDRRFCKRIDVHEHPCRWCVSTEHSSEKHACETCKQEGHPDYDCQRQTYCEKCKGKVGHLTSVHYFCDKCKRDVFTRHTPCPTKGCKGCAAETLPPLIWYRYEVRVKCDRCKRTWEDLDCVLYEHLGNQ